MSKKWFIVIILMFICCGAGVVYLLTTPDIDPTKKSGVYMMLVGAIGLPFALMLKSKVANTDDSSVDGRFLDEYDDEEDEDY